MKCEEVLLEVLIQGS